MQGPEGGEAGSIAEGQQLPVHCALTIGAFKELQTSERFCWYPFWFLCTFVMDIAEDLDEKLKPFLDTAEVESEVHGLCCHALDVLSCGCISTYRYRPTRSGLR